MQTPEPSNRPLTLTEKAKQEKDRKKAEQGTADAIAMEEHKNFRAPATTTEFVIPKQNAGESSSSWMARVRQAREEFNKNKGQKNAIKQGNEKK